MVVEMFRIASTDSDGSYSQKNRNLTDKIRRAQENRVPCAPKRGKVWVSHVRACAHQVFPNTPFALAGEENKDWTSRQIKEHRLHQRYVIYLTGYDYTRMN